ncbi:YobI family P-loop NTPase [Chryseobacterium sp. A301]
MLKSIVHKIGLKNYQEAPDRKSLSSLAAKVLTNEKEVARVQPYLIAIKNAIEEPTITNIAITGAYGSGKSTIIKTFQHLNPQNKYLYISLASFNDSNSTGDMERLLEVSILQQIFYHVKPDEIPDSRFKRIINNTTSKIWSIAIGFILWICSIFILFKFNYIRKINPDTWIMRWENIDWITFLVFLIFFFGIGIFSKTVVRLFSNSKINKLNIQGEVELGDDIDKSVFNEHLEEILYFFERTDYNVIVIEDLDRFENTDIFTKLREINILLNNSKSIQSKRGNEKINFLYAIKDDMFKNKNERVKFFEFIVPIIPFINPSNADEQLSKLISEAELESVLSQEFISDVITFIDDIDMRLLINIFHEFVLYRDALNPEFVTKPEELFAIITYKNLNPNDFMKLHRREGVLYQFINNKSKYVSEIIKEIDEQIINNIKDIKQIEDEVSKSVIDLRIIYINAILCLLPQNATLFIEAPINELTDDENFENYIINNNVTYNLYTQFDTYRFNQTKSKLDFKFPDIESEINSDFTYSEREQFIFDKTSDKVQILKLEIEKLKNKRQEVKSWDIKQIFEETDISTYLDVFAGSPLMRNLLINGYLNENYNDYISLFHEVSLTKEDFIFEKKVKSGEALAFDYNLTNIETVISKIPEKYFRRDSILNFDLLDYLGNNHSKYKSLFDNILNVLGNEKEKSIVFIDSYIHREDFPKEIFMSSICKSWPGLIYYLYNDSIYTEEKQNLYLELLIKFVSNEDIVEFQNEDLLKDMIEEKPYFLSMIKSTIEIDYFEKVSSLFKKIGVKFSDLDPVKDDTKRLFDYVYKNDCYQINAENIEAMMLEYSKEIQVGNLGKAHFNSILLSKCEHLIGYVKGYINTYVKKVFLKLEGNSEEPEESFLILLNNHFLDKKLKQDVINKYSFKISTISDIEDSEIKTMLVASNKIVPNWENVIDYYIDWDSSLEKSLIDFLNNSENFHELSKEKMDMEGDYGYTEFRKNILLCSDLSDESYMKLFENSMYTTDQLAFENLSIEKVKYLVENILTLSEENYSLLKEKFPHQHLDLIANYQSKFIENFEKYSLDKKDIILLLGNLTKIEHQTKIEIIKMLDSDVIISSKGISIIVCDILSNASYIPLEYQILEGLFSNATSVDNRIELLNIQFSKLTIEAISNLVTILPYPYSEIAVRRKRPKIPLNKRNREFANNLNSQGLISSFEVKGNEIKIVANY